MFVPSEIVANGPREPGVGAELIGTGQSLSFVEAELNKIPISRMDSLASSDTDIEDINQDFEVSYKIKRCRES